MQAGRFLSIALMGLILIGMIQVAHAQNTSPVQVNVSDLGKYIGKTVIVQGRTGYIITKFESQGLHAFTLRDDYNNEIMVRTIGDTYPVMGATYRVTGSPTRIGGNLFLDSAPDMMSSMYPITVAVPVPDPTPPSLKSQILLWMPTALSGLGILLILGYVLVRQLNRTPPEWGVLSVTSGPDRGLTVPLHRRRIAIGRGVNPAQDIRLSSGDQTISNRHALLHYRKGQLQLCDMSSNGTRIGGEKLMTDRPVPVNSGDLIHLGTRGTVVIVRLHSAPAQPGLLGLLREPAPLSDKTMMLSEIPVSEPAWRNLASEAPVTEEEPRDEVAEQPSQEDLPKDHEALPAYEHGPVERNGQEIATEGEEDEEDMPQTLAPPQVFTFAGHAPKPNRIMSSNGHEPQSGTDESSNSLA
jgi:hypothetical protein